MEVVTETKITELPLAFQDDVRDVYTLPRQQQLVVYTDRMPLRGSVLNKPVPFRGFVLNQITLYWVNRFTHLVGHNIVAQQFERFPQELRAHAAALKGRSVITQTLKPLPLRFRVVGNLAGDDWREYRETRRVGGRLLGRGLQEADRLEQPVLIPVPNPELARLEIDDIGKWAQRMYGPKLFSTLEDICLSIFGVARNYAAPRGIIIADTWFEFALHEGTPYIINQVMTPDSSSYWPVEGFAPGGPQPSLEKQELLDWLDLMGWNADQPLPEVHKELLSETTKKYRMIFDVMTGRVALPKKEEQA